MRIEFAQPHFKIIKTEQPGEGGAYIRDLKKLFPTIIFNRYLSSKYLSSKPEDNDLLRELATKAGVRH